MSPISSVCAGGGRIYAGTIDGGLFMWKECLAMMNLRKWSFGRPDTHGYRGRVARATSITMSVEPEADQAEPEADAESLRSFAKVADSDISESDMENDYSAEPVMISLSESIPDVSSSRQSRASTLSNSLSNVSRTNRASTTSSPAPQHNMGSINRSNSSMSGISRPPSNSFSSSPIVSRQPETQSAPIPTATATMTYEQQIIQLLNDSVAGLATLPEPSKNPIPTSNSPISSMNTGSITQSMQSLSIKSPAPIVSQTQSPPSSSSEGDNRCVVCLDNLKDSILYQCGHVCVCLGCGKELVSRKMKCPMCRAEIKDCILLYK